MTPWRVPFFMILLAAVAFLITPVAGQATPLDRWQVSCSVQKGSITRKGRTWVFKTSPNMCPGGVFTQRAEIYTDRVRPNHKGSYLFEAHISMRTDTTEKFGVFQMHDGRLGCAPPLKLDVLPSGRLELVSDYKTGPGESCVRGKLTERASPAKIRRDGTEQKLAVLVDFDGSGGFYVAVWLDDALQLDGTYRLPPGQGYFKSEFFYFKHGVYSQRMFDYVLVSRDMRVKRVRLAR